MTASFRDGAARFLWLFWAVLAASLVGCRDGSCSGDNGKMCDFFPPTVLIKQNEPRLHFTAIWVTEGTCEPPTCHNSTCTELAFTGASLPSVPSTSSGEPLPEARCRFLVSTAEGQSLDVVVSLAGMDRTTACCCTGQPSQGACNAVSRQFIGYSWAVSVNGVELGTNIVTLPEAWDGGTAPLDAATP